MIREWSVFFKIKGEYLDLPARKLNAKTLKKFNYTEGNTKMLAANQAGSYLIETETLSGSQYTQELSLISSTFLGNYAAKMRNSVVFAIGMIQIDAGYLFAQCIGSCFCRFTAYIG